MILLELAAQGVRGVAPAGGRVALRPGYNVVAADGAALRRLLETLFQPDARDADLVPRAAAGPGGAAVRAGLTLVGNDRLTYRLVRDYAAGCQLHRFDPARRAFALVSQDLPEIARVLRETVGVPAPARLGALLALSAAELPSRQAGGAGPAGAPPGRPALPPEKARARVAELEAELARAKAAEKLQARLDALQQRLFASEEAMKAGARVRDGLAQAEAARAELGPVARVRETLGDAEARLAAYDKAEARREEALARAAAEREATGGDAAPAPPPPPWRRPGLWAGIGAGLACGVLGAVGAARGSGLRYAALLDLPAFGWAAWEGLRWIGALEGAERATRKRRVVDEWERKQLEAYEREVADVRAAVAASGFAKPSELREALGRLSDADAVVAEWRRRLEEWEASPEARDARAERDAIALEMGEVETALQQAAGGFVRDPRSIEGELARLRTELSAPPAPARPAAAAPAAQGTIEPIRALVARAASQLAATPAAALLSVQTKASLALAALSLGRLASLAADEKGNVIVTAGGRATPALALPPADRDLVWLALRLAFLEGALASGAGVALADDLFAGLPEAARRAAARLLKGIARPGQLVHATADAAFREAADHAA